MLAPFECLCGNFILPEPASYVFFYTVFNLRNLLYIIEKRRSIKLRPRTDRYINLEIKNAEYHQQTFSDPLMILRMECVDKKDVGAKSCVARFCGLLRLDFPFLQFEPPAFCDDG